MNRNATRSRLRGARLSILCGLISIVAGLAGCGGSAEVMEVPEAARKSVLRKKVDVHVQPRPSKSSKTGPGSSNGRPAGR